MSEIQKINSSQEVEDFKRRLEIAQEYAKVVKTSNFGKLFEKSVPDTENNLDEEGKPTKNKIIVDENDIVANILMGRNLGLDDMVSVSFGRNLSSLSFFQIQKGKNIGLDIATSLQSIYAYEQNGKVITGIDGKGINAIILKAGIKYKYIADFKPKKYYRDYASNIFLGYDWTDDFFIMKKGVDPNIAKEASTNNKTFVRECWTLYTEIEFYREGWEPYRESYSLLDATEAGLYKGIDFNGIEVKGKPAWNGNPKRILMTRVISIGGSRIGGDALNGLISLDELNEIKNVDAPVDISHEEIT